LRYVEDITSAAGLPHLTFEYREGRAWMT
jgi:hypothetical protein